MTQSQEIVIRLLEIALGEDSEKEFSLDSTNVNWQEVMDVASCQGVLGVCFDGVEKLNVESRPNMDSLMDWLGQTSYQETQYEHSWEVACELSGLWQDVGVKATVLKGRSIAQYYPKPEHRYSCDLDVWIPSASTSSIKESGDWDKACEVLKAKGVKLEFEVYKEVEFTYKDMYVECHRYITPVRGNENLLKFERYLRSLLAAEHSMFEGTQLIAPPLMFTALLYVEHALGDFLRSPLTLKHVCDWMVLRKQDLNWANFHQYCKKYGFERFLLLVDAMADVIEGKKNCEELPGKYRRAFDEVFEVRKGSTRMKSWTERRVNQFFNVLKCRWKYRAFGYMSMQKYLYHALRTHWFEKEVKIL